MASTKLRLPGDYEREVTSVQNQVHTGGNLKARGADGKESICGCGGRAKVAMGLAARAAGAEMAHVL
ncbi:hypothetical protein SBA5_330098 [Candidatus Sulfotelmatomonas gaucii]|uniref:Uncharacterized protein n=1 Tax=Candidatus Sulfuritelmatomonas gaucii TaxID=2043161 RepID=A0A2N9LFM2_9BACT|nr:hypothetical protein SBA5_330098 [Candidatus Sulfotelmatomonas gaucii]